MIGRDKLKCACAIAVLALAAAQASWAQDASKPTDETTVPGEIKLRPPGDPSPLDIPASQERMRSAMRQKQLITDTEKLVALANELKASVDKSNKDTMSLDVIRKADEIEKLAHTVKEKMKGS
jgi:hypothetical protein